MLSLKQNLKALVKWLFNLCCNQSFVRRSLVWYYTAYNSRVLNKAGGFWDNFYADKNKKGERLFWWDSEKVVSYINELICGQPLTGRTQGLISLLEKSAHNCVPYKRGLSIGCGEGLKELNLIQQGVVEYFDLYEISVEAVRKIEDNAGAMNLSAQIKVCCGDYFAGVKEDCYDFIYWDNSLHHMFDVREVVRITCKSLKSGGCFFVDEYVGRNHQQFSREEIRLVNSFRKTLPERVFASGSGRIPRYISAPLLLTMLRSDPTEGIDSENIIPALQEFFPAGLFIPTGGLIYHLGLNQIIENIAEDDPLLAAALRCDSELNEKGYYHYAVFLGFKE